MARGRWEHNSGLRGYEASSSEGTHRSCCYAGANVRRLGARHATEPPKPVVWYRYELIGGVDTPPVLPELVDDHDVAVEWFGWRYSRSGMIAQLVPMLGDVGE